MMGLSSYGRFPFGKGCPTPPTMKPFRQRVIELLPPHRGRGIYFLVMGSRIDYVGQSGCVWRRIGQHIDSDLKTFDRVYFLPYHGNLDRLEAAFIGALRPKLNLKGPGFAVPDLSPANIYQSEVGELP